MEARDTVMKPEELAALITSVPNDMFFTFPFQPEYLRLMKAIEKQAEISFKLRTEDIIEQLSEFNQRGLTITEVIASLK